MSVFEMTKYVIDSKLSHLCYNAMHICYHHDMICRATSTIYYMLAAIESV